MCIHAWVGEWTDRCLCVYVCLHTHLWAAPPPFHPPTLSPQLGLAGVGLFQGGPAGAIGQGQVRLGAPEGERKRKTGSGLGDVKRARDRPLFALSF